MAEIARNTLEDLERYRLQLETNIASLRKALKHWQTWEVEYESLKEELQDLPADSGGDDLVKAARRAEGQLLNEKEINELLGRGKSPSRTASQIVALTSRRIDYVQRNAESLQKQVDAAEIKLAGMTVVIQPEADTEEGLPVTDIYEELDADGNTISGKIVRPGEAASDVLDVLKKAGIHDEELGNVKQDANAPSLNVENPETIAQSADSISDAIPSSFANGSDLDIEKNRASGLRPRKKSVSFADGTKEPHNDTKSTSVLHSLPTAIPLPRTGNPTPNKEESNITDTVFNVDEPETPLSYPVIPEDESPEDAALRREMIQYHLSEVGSIVAQLDLDENEDSYSGSDENESNMDSTSLTDEEDQYGISLDRGIDDELRAEMMALEKRLGAQMFQNIGPEVDRKQSTDIVMTEGSSILKKPTSTDAQDSSVKEKTVRFANKLEVAPPPATPTVAAAVEREIAAPSPMSEKVIERPITASSSATAVAPTNKPSRFKAARMSNNPSTAEKATPNPPTSITPLASRIVEHGPTASDSANRPSSPDEFDPALIRQQVAQEYYRQRNRMISKEGGFSRQRQEEQEMADFDAEDGEDYEENGNSQDYEDEDDDDDDEPEPVKKVSLFKAARLNKSGLK